METASNVAVVLLGVIALFQLALALGAPWGAAAWGGQNPGVLPTGLRVASGLTAVVVYPLIALFVLASANRLDATWLPTTGNPGMWVLAGFFVVGTIANLASRSKPERGWALLSAALAGSCAVIASQL